MKKYYLLALFTIVTFFPGIISTTVQAQNSNSLLSVYLDCRRGCNSTFIRSEINFINFVRDQADSEIHLIITQQRTANGGSEYNLSFIGQKELFSISNELIYTSFDSDTDEEERNGLVQYVKLGLVPFLAQKNSLRDFDISFRAPNNNTPNQRNDDNWNNWVFEIGGNGSFSGQESRNNLNLGGRFRARRVTEQWKTQFNYDYNYRRELYRSTDDDTGQEIEDVFTTDNQSAFGLVAYALSDHWSVGSYFRGGTSSRNNIDLQYGATPSIEYSFYPYREYARREATMRYGVYTSYFDYTETTIFGKDSEILARQELEIDMEYTKPWGGLEVRLSGQHYLHDFSKNRLNTRFEIDMRVVRGFNVFFAVGYSIINDQLSLSANGVTDKEAIANTRQQATSYDYWGRVGFEITFGSIYDNVVNTRF